MAVPVLSRRGGARASGFTLIELGVVIVVIALLLGSILVPLSTQVRQRQVAETEGTLAEVREALIGYAMKNGVLPCPATSATNGVQKATCATDADATGYIPWTTLGVRHIDAYGKIIRYSVTPAFTVPPISLSTVPNRDVYARPNNAAATSILVDDVPAIIWSHGSTNWGTTDGGTDMGDGSTTNTDEDTNSAPSGTAALSIVTRVANNNASANGGEFDDIVDWIPTGLLINRLVSAGRLP